MVPVLATLTRIPSRIVDTQQTFAGHRVATQRIAHVQIVVAFTALATSANLLRVAMVTRRTAAAEKRLKCDTLLALVSTWWMNTAVFLYCNCRQSNINDANSNKSIK